MITINGKQYKAGDRFVVIDTESHYFPLGEVIEYTGEYDVVLESYNFRGSNPWDSNQEMEQYLYLDQINPLLPTEINQ